jgi:hypothetical protein
VDLSAAADCMFGFLQRAESNESPLDCMASLLAGEDHGRIPAWHCTSRDSIRRHPQTIHALRLKRAQQLATCGLQGFWSWTTSRMFDP